ncbi:YciI family protein [Galactobacter sp.]|uniref:YciI family protein n=1 Tax=Galactobacter sp. TaxID=2676125 RepID=UPI0025C40E5E|nr:YciI family protein [Galactobacter sp.]
MSLFAVSYVYAENSDAGRDEHRPKHLEFLQGLFDSGTLVVSGPTDAVEGHRDGALLIIRAVDAAAAEQTMANDPFAQLGFVERVVRPWTPKFGAARLADDAQGA